MDDILRHSLVFIPLFFLLRWKLKTWIVPLFIIVPFIGEAVQIIFPQSWGFQFEWEDVAINYFSSAAGWALMAAIRENQKIIIRRKRKNGITEYRHFWPRHH